MVGDLWGLCGVEESVKRGGVERLAGTDKGRHESMRECRSCFLADGAKVSEQKRTLAVAVRC